MNLKRILLLLLFALSQMINLFSQRVEFTYDDNGNRHTRTIVVQELQSKSVEFPVINPKELQLKASAKAKSFDVLNSESSDNKSFEEEKVARERISKEEGEITTNVYPNPNRGLINIEISNMPLNSSNEMRLYDLNGNEIAIRKSFNSHSEIDITQFKDGIYILRIRIGDKTFDWKVIKNVPYNY